MCVCLDESKTGENRGSAMCRNAGSLVKIQITQNQPIISKYPNIDQTPLAFYFVLYFVLDKYLDMDRRKRSLNIMICDRRRRSSTPVGWLVGWSIGHSSNIFAKI